MTKEQLEQKLARLESINDQLMSEITTIDGMMRIIGFTNGLASLKETGEEFHKYGDQYFEEMS